MIFKRNSSNAYKMPNRRKRLLTINFLRTFKEELDKRVEDSIENEVTYWGHYFHLEGMDVFYEALKSACDIHNLSKGIYEYMIKLPKDKQNQFNGRLLILMVEQGIICEGNIYDGIPSYDSNDISGFEFVESVREFSGYNVVSSEWKIREKEIIQNIEMKD